MLNKSQIVQTVLLTICSIESRVYLIVMQQKKQKYSKVRNKIFCCETIVFQQKMTTYNIIVWVFMENYG